MKKFTAQDVKDAYLAKTVIADAKTQECTPESLLLSLGGDEDKSLMGQLARGKEILKSARIVTTNDRMDATLSSEMAATSLEKKGIDSPVVEVYAGYVATSQMKKVVALQKLSN